MPRWLVPAFFLMVLISFVPFAIISKARSDLQRSPRINLIPDMDYQPKYLPQTANELFADGRAMRTPPEGTVARGADALAEDDLYYRGRMDSGEWGALPARAMEDFGSWEALLARGQQRYEIYCAPCHGVSGDGNGMVSNRALELMEQGLAAWTPPTSMHDETVLEREDGHLFNTITHGIRNMPAYRTQISTADRWAIVGYIRALQRSQRATMEDVPADARDLLERGGDS